MPLSRYRTIRQNRQTVPHCNLLVQLIISVASVIISVAGKRSLQQFHVNCFFELLDVDLIGSFCTKRIDRNWLGKELGDAEEEAHPGADCDAAAAD